MVTTPYRPREYFLPTRGSSAQHQLTQEPAHLGDRQLHESPRFLLNASRLSAPPFGFGPPFARIRCLPLQPGLRRGRRERTKRGLCDGTSHPSFSLRSEPNLPLLWPPQIRSPPASGCRLPLPTPPAAYPQHRTLCRR